MEFCSRQTHAQLQAATIMSIPYIISACLSPVLGEFISLSHDYDDVVHDNDDDEVHDDYVTCS